MPERLGIVGFGIVGSAVAYGFSDRHQIMVYDKYKEDVCVGNFQARTESLEDVVAGSDIIFVCLPTPMHNNGIDLSIMNQNIEQIAIRAKGTNKIITIKSTVVPGTTRTYAERYGGVNFCFNPEFLTEANYLLDFVNADRNVVGADNNQVGLRVGALYIERFPNTPLYRTDLTTAEVVKYMANCMLATRVIAANEWHDICGALGVKYDEVKKMVAADKRIGSSHLDITSERGVGGKCFPKDIVAMIGRAKELGVDVSVMEAVWNKNLRIRKHKDWEEIPGATSDGAKYDGP